MAYEGLEGDPVVAGDDRGHRVDGPGPRGEDLAHGRAGVRAHRRGRGPREVEGGIRLGEGLTALPCGPERRVVAEEADATVPVGDEVLEGAACPALVVAEDGVGRLAPHRAVDVDDRDAARRGGRQRHRGLARGHDDDPVDAAGDEALEDGPLAQR